MAVDPLSGLPLPGNQDDEDCLPEDVAEFSPREVQYLEWVTAELSRDIGAVEQLFTGMIDEAKAEADDALRLAEMGVSEMCGQLALELDTALGGVEKMPTRMIGEADRALSNMADELWSVGITVPYSWGQQADALKGDPIDLLVTAIPTIYQSLGLGAGVVINSVPPPAPQEGTFNAGIGFNTSVPVPVPVEPIVPALTPFNSFGGGTGEPQSGSGTCPPSAGDKARCPDVKVTVVVPPISVNLPKATEGTGDGTSYVSGPGLGGSEVGPVPEKANVPTLPGMVPEAVPNQPNVPPNLFAPGTGPGTGVTPPSPPSPPAPPRVPPAPRPTPVTPLTTFANPPTILPNVGQNLQHGQISSPIGTLVSATPDWNKLTVCADMPAVSRIAERSGVGKNTLPWKPGDNAFENQTLVGGMSLGDLVEKIAGKGARDAISGVTDGLTVATDKIVDNAASTITTGILWEALGATRKEQTLTIQYHAAKVAMASFVEEKTHLPFTYLFQPDQYALQYWAPQYLPDQSATDHCYLRGFIDKDTWECWTRAQGNLPEPARHVMLSQQAQPSPGEVIQLWYRGLLSDDEMFVRMRQLGVLTSSNTQEWIELAKDLPTQSDLIRFMVRDADDPAVVKDYDLDKEFDQKAGGQIKAWAKALGLPLDVLKYNWRSHWEMPSNTALYEMVRRLRPDRPEVLEWEKSRDSIGEAATRGTLGEKPTVVTIADVKRAMEVNDLMPGWVQPSLEVSYAPITRTDAIRAYEIGVFDEERLYHAYRDNGYNERDARTLVTYTQQLKRRRTANATGTWTTRKVVRYYKEGRITRDAAGEYLAPLVPGTAAVQSILLAADQELEADARSVRLKAIRRGLFAGEVSVEGAALRLQESGADEGQRKRLLEQWTLERDTRYKQPTAAMLKKWWEGQAITSDDYFRRLVNLGYTEKDAKTILLVSAGIEDEAGELTAKDVVGGIGAAIKNAIGAKQASTKRLGTRHDQALSEVKRIRKELNERLRGEGKPKLQPIVLD